MNETIFSFMY